MPKIRNQNKDFNTDFTEIKMIISEYYKQPLPTNWIT